MTSTHTVFNTKSQASIVAARERVGSVEYPSVVFVLHLDITANQFNEYLRHCPQSQC